MALIVVFAVLVNFSTFANGSVGLDFGQEIEINRALIEADPELSAGLCGQSIEAWDAGDYAAFFELRAQELEDPVQGMKPPRGALSRDGGRCRRCRVQACLRVTRN